MTDSAEPDAPPAPGAATGGARRRAPSARGRARELALQGLYRWLIARDEPERIASDLSDAEAFARADRGYFRELLLGTAARATEIEAAYAPLIDRPAARLDPIERAILMLAGFELRYVPDVPYRVVINEAIELAKRYGGVDGHKYVNGVLDRLAPLLRPDEAADPRAVPGDRASGSSESRSEMMSIRVRVYLFYVAAVVFAALGFWMISRALFGDGGITALAVGAVLLLTGMVDYWMGGYLKKLYLDPQAGPSARSEPSRNG